MSTLLERNTGILSRIDRLDPIAGRIADVLKAGKRAQLLAGVDSEGRAFAPLAASTLAGPRRRPGGPLIPGGESADLVVHYEVDVTVEAGRVVASAGWPFGFVRYLRSGTRRMPRRDPGGFREQDRRAVNRIVVEYLLGG